MHFVEPYFNWRGYYVASEDPLSPFFEREYSEFEFTNSIYDFYIHPQWDSIGSPTLFIKILMVDYDAAYAIIEIIGEWNDAIENDIMICDGFRRRADPGRREAAIEIIFSERSSKETERFN